MTRLTAALIDYLNELHEKNERLWAELDELEEEGSEEQHALYEAARDGDLPAVKQILSEDVDIDWQNPEKYLYTAMHAATYSGHLDVVRALLEAGAFVDTQDEDGMTPLLLAAFWGHATLVEALLDAGADRDITEEVCCIFTLCCFTNCHFLEIRNDCRSLRARERTHRDRKYAKTSLPHSHH